MLRFRSARFSKVLITLDTYNLMFPKREINFGDIKEMKIFFTLDFFEHFGPPQFNVLLNFMDSFFQFRF